MKRPEKYVASEIEGQTATGYGNVYLATDIDPLLDDYFAMKEREAKDKKLMDEVWDEVQKELDKDEIKADKKPFPSLEEFHEWYMSTETGGDEMAWCKKIMDYLSQFCYEKTVFPKVGDMVEGTSFGELMIRGKLIGFKIESAGDTFSVNEIRPVTTPTREEVIKSINNKLENGTDEIIFDRELVEQFLQILTQTKQQ